MGILNYSDLSGNGIRMKGTNKLIKRTHTLSFFVSVLQAPAVAVPASTKSSRDHDFGWHRLCNCRNLAGTDQQLPRVLYLEDSASLRKQATGRPTNPNWVKSMMCTMRSPLLCYLGSLNHLGFHRNQQALPPG